MDKMVDNKGQTCPPLPPPLKVTIMPGSLVGADYKGSMDAETYAAFMEKHGPKKIEPEPEPEPEPRCACLLCPPAHPDLSYARPPARPHVYCARPPTLPPCSVLLNYVSLAARSV